MRRIQKILIGAFLCGVLLTGVGTGVAMVEYSSLVYAGEKQIGEENIKTVELDFKLAEDVEKVVLVNDYWSQRSRKGNIEEDADVPERTVRYVVTYNPKTVEVHLAFERDGEIESKGYLNLRGEYCGNDFAMFMESKDQILKDLREKRVSSYDIAYITDIKIKVNPKTLPYIENAVYY